MNLKFQRKYNAVGEMAPSAFVDRHSDRMLPPKVDLQRNQFSGRRR